MRAGPDGRWRAGLHTFDQPDVVFDLHDCHIADERLLSLWRDVLKASDALPEVRELRGTVRLAGEHGAFTLEGATAWPRAAEFAERLPRFVGVWWVPAHGRRRAIFANPDAAAAASFTQVNPAMGARLLDYLERLVVGASPLHVIDAYSGHGALAARLHQRGIRVTAIELDEDATAFAAARLTPPSRAVAAKVEDAMARALPADLVVLNPPRAGVDARVTAALRAPDGPRRAIYISCDPATLARDISRLPSWEIDSVQAFDMFPQTAHVETVVALSRTRG
jgi:23S rRNA (uracil1939-C5)-methyltransferase